MKSLVLFTVSYPYGNKEQFLETEILYLSKYFSMITIIPTYSKGERRKVPRNVSVDTDFSTGHSNLIFFACSFFCKDLYQEIFKNPFVLTSLTRLNKLFAFVGKGFCLHKHLKKNYSSEDIFYSYWFNGSVFGSYLYSKDRTDISFYTRVHRGDVYLDINKGYLPLRTPILKRINKVFCISEHAGQYLKDRYSLNPSIIEVSRLGIQDLGITTKMSTDKDSIQLLSCSHLSPVKRVELLLEALVLVAKDNPKKRIKWVHLGGGERFEYIQDLYSKFKLDNLECHLVGEVSNADVLQYYKTHNIDLFINVSSSEGIPVTFMEAFACSIPVLGIDSGGVSEIVTNENGALLGLDSTAESIAAKIGAFVQNKELLIPKKSKARSTWEKSYNADSNYLEFCKALNTDD